MSIRKLLIFLSRFWHIFITYIDILMLNEFQRYIGGITSPIILECSRFLVSPSVGLLILAANSASRLLEREFVLRSFRDPVYLSLSNVLHRER